MEPEPDPAPIEDSKEDAMFFAAVVAEELEVPAPEGSPNAEDPMSTGPYDPLTPAECRAATPALKRFRRAGEAVAGSGGVGW